MKRILTLLLCTVLSLSLFVGCADKSSNDAGKNTGTDSGAGKITPSAAPSENTPSVPDHGVWNGNVFTNDFAEIKFTIPDTWIASTDDEIAQMIGIATDVLTDKWKYATEAAKLTSIYDMMAKNIITNDNILLMFENLTLSGSSQTTAAQYLSILKTSLPTASTIPYEISKDTFETKVAGQTYLTLQADVPAYDMTQFYLVRRQGGYMTTICVTLLGAASLDEIIDMFS